LKLPHATDVPTIVTSALWVLTARVVLARGGFPGAIKRYSLTPADDTGPPAPLSPAVRRAARVSARVVSMRVLGATCLPRSIALARVVARHGDRADIVLTPMVGGPPPLNTEVADHGLARSLYRSNAAAWAAPWNAIGQPAASVPAGFDSQGLPLAVQLCGRPRDEATILQVAAQLEEARPWAGFRPPVDGPAAMPDDRPDRYPR